MSHFPLLSPLSSLLSPPPQVPFQPKGGDPRRILIITALIFLIFLSRSAFDFTIITGTNVIEPDNGQWLDEFTNFCLYALWEITPTTSIIFLFWNIPKTDVGFLRVGMGKTPAKQSSSIQADTISTPLFNDRHRYDSDDDESTNLTKGRGSAPLYGTPHYPYVTSSFVSSVAGHSPYPTSGNMPYPTGDSSLSPQSEKGHMGDGSSSSDDDSSLRSKDTSSYDTSSIGGGSPDAMDW